jgi:tetratricopeptide (TPR) repeat protein
MGSIYQGQYIEAQSLIQRAIEIWRQALGDTHPLIGRGLNNLGMLYAAQGQNQVAESSYVEALEILESRIGTEHPWTVRCRENLEQLRDEG